MKRIFLLATLLIITTIAQAQKAKLSGKVTNSKNEALIGVTIFLKSDKGVTTKSDVEGRFVFNIDIKKEYVLAFSYVGYKEKTVPGIIANTSGEELTYDYGKEYFNEFIKPIGCKCVKCISKNK